MSLHRRQRAYRFGLGAETAAAFLLRAKGYRILARRHRTPVGEIDLIARRGRHFAFVEVKARGRWADEILSRHQRARIVRAAEAWLAAAGARGQLPADYGVSFDLVLVTPWRLPRHIAEAFRARV